VRDWLVAAGIIEGPDGYVLVQNRRSDGRLDWTTPGGVIEVHDGETVLSGLTREVAEETGVEVSEWVGPVYDVDVTAAGLGWHLRVEVYVARRWEGELAARPSDPDGIVVDARFVAPAEAVARLRDARAYVREPLAEFMAGNKAASAHYRYRIDGDTFASATISRLDNRD